MCMELCNLSKELYKLIESHDPHFWVFDDVAIVANIMGSMDSQKSIKMVNASFDKQ